MGSAISRLRLSSAFPMHGHLILCLSCLLLGIGVAASRSHHYGGLRRLLFANARLDPKRGKGVSAGGLVVSQEEQVRLLDVLEEELKGSIAETDASSAKGLLTGVTEEDRQIVREQLGKEPQGLLAVARRSSKGVPQILLVDPVAPDGTPFPTFYWMSDPVLKSAISEVEKVGTIKQLEEEEIPNSEELQKTMMNDNLQYIRERWKYVSKESLGKLKNEKCEETLTKRGIGGCVDFTRVRCLHMHYAFHLMTPTGTALGRFLDEKFDMASNT
uniref:DUF501 domain-containing protein n=1 Tax=Chromera velia CCMP2878 TaxID=1169474 RepID=A0A0G4IB48_9ALVE|mmetsp:Transcript_346/g.797  ORF Transcript_346/g.797 Transcript_346/m.797 type:complete len:272 (-) Transcript_346:129-944(-)|eukprot:Cvel_12754.t1-p1 / transcript=Cvel_12754.t1 / gene=Cvel_12754 / organism=Chromera_velia_CCMP2878 / gene_product=hypothetical protein / transcript_product=hypothetical protein / location=Cvel_scaffold848:9219-12992(+) / protein_length=271 / sequence_SO=supercontig / SO=protein_coding / is_pseudo=false